MGFIVEKAGPYHECPKLPEIKRDDQGNINYPPGSTITCEECNKSWLCYAMPSMYQDEDSHLVWGPPRQQRPAPRRGLFGRRHAR